MYWSLVGSTFQPGRGLEMANPLARLLDLRRRPLQQARQPVDVVLREAVEVVGDDRARGVAQLGVLDLRQLQEQALGDVARGDAGRIERLHALERDLHLDRLDRRVHSRRRRELVEVDAQVAVVVERLDDRAGEGMVAPIERQHVDLPVQVLAQADVGGDHVERADIALGVRLAHVRRRLLPVLALVRSVGDRRHRIEVDAARLAIGAGRTDVDAARVGRRILDFEEGIAAHRLLHFLSEVERGELQQSNRVLQPGRDGVLLTLTGLKGLKGHGIDAVESVVRACARGATAA